MEDSSSVVARGEHNKALTTILTPYSLLLAPFFFSLLLTPCSLFLWRAKRVCVLCGKSQRRDRRRQRKCGSRMRGQSKKNSALNSHFAKGVGSCLEDREVREALSCLDVRRWRVSCRPQGAFVAGGARRRRLSWSRPPAARRLGAGASRGHETARCAVHENPLARDAKASRPPIEARKRFAPFSTRRNK